MTFIVTGESSKEKLNPIIISTKGAKNAILPLMLAKIFVPGTTIFKNAPTYLEDVKSMCEILTHFGLNCQMDKDLIIIKNAGIKIKTLPSGLASKTRYSSLLLGIYGSLNMDTILLPFPGGCQLQATRPLDIHFKCLDDIGYIIIKEKQGMRISSKTINQQTVNTFMNFPSVGATLNCIFCSLLKNQTTIIKNCAIEPEIIDVINFLNKSGASIDIKERVLKIVGQPKLKSVSCHRVLEDRIAGMSYFMMSIMRNQSSILYIPTHIISATIDVLKKLGIPLIVKNNYVEYKRRSKLIIKPGNIVFSPFPGVPTDLQPIFCVFMLKARGTSMLTDMVYPQRTQYIKQLKKMGANVHIKVQDNLQHIIITNYTPKLYSAKLNCPDIRGGMALIIAASIANGYSFIRNEYQIKRGYNNVFNILKDMGVNIEQKN